jgi:hypothetical protein
MSTTQPLHSANCGESKLRLHALFSCSSYRLEGNPAACSTSPQMLEIGQSVARRKTNMDQDLNGLYESSQRAMIELHAEYWMSWMSS